MNGEPPAAANGAPDLSLGPAARATLVLGAGEAASKAMAFLATTYLARTLGPASLGTLALATAIVSYFLIPVEFGLRVYGVRDVARGGGVAKMAGRIISLRLLLAIVAAGLLFAVTPLLGRSAETEQVIYWHVFTLLTSALALAWTFQALEKMWVVAAARAMNQAGYAAAVLLLVHGSADLTRVPVAKALGDAAAIAFLLVLLARLGQLPDLRVRLSELRETAVGALPLAGGQLVNVIRGSADVIVLGFLSSESVVGHYSAASRIVLAVLGINSVFGTAVLPRIARARGAPKADVSRMITRLVYGTAAVTLPMAAGIALLARPIARFCFGAGFEDAALPLALLAGLVVLTPTASQLRRVLWAFDLPARDTAILSVTTLALAVIALALIPWLGGAGAALALLSAEALQLWLLTRQVRASVAPFALASGWGPPAIATLVMAGSVKALSPFGIFVAIPAGAAIYAVALVVLGGMRGVRGRNRED